MPAPAFSSATSHAGNPTTSGSITLPTTAADDILVLTLVNAGATTVPTPAGTYTGSWTSVDSGTWTTGAGGTWWSRCTGNHSGQTVTWSATDSTAGSVMRVTGCVTSGSPVDGSSGASVAAANGSLAGFDTTAGDTLVVLTVAFDDNQAWSGQTKNSVAMTERSEASSTGGGDSMVGAATLEQAAAGATGSFAITQSAGTGQGKRLTGFALKPAGVTNDETGRSELVMSGSGVSAVGRLVSKAGIGVIGP